MGSSYSDDLKSPQWQKKRLEILNRDEFTCQHCGSKDNQLQIHHLCYHRGKKPWNCPDEDLITLCKECHEQAEAVIKAVRRITKNFFMVKFIRDVLKKSPDDLRHLCTPIHHIDSSEMRNFLASLESILEREYQHGRIIESSLSNRQ